MIKLDYNNIQWGNYLEDTGNTLRWVNPVSSRVKAGDIVKTENNKGYLILNFNNKRYLVHRILWIIRNGEIPNSLQVDHMNGNKKDNSPDNLRLCTHSQNIMNQKVRSDNSSGVKGLHYNISDKLWECYVESNRKRCRKKFKEKDDAMNWLKENRLKLHGEFSK